MSEMGIHRPLLAFDTSTGLGSVAVGVGGRVMARRFLARQGAHASGLIPAIRDSLAEAGFSPGDLGGILVGQGPGSFTGVRVAAATARGFATATGVSVWPVSSLVAGAASTGVAVTDEAAAWMRRLAGAADADVLEGGWAGESPGWTRPAGVLFDARGERLYAGVFRFSAEGWQATLAPTACTLSELLALPPESLPPDTVFAGDGALRHSARIRAAGFAVVGPPQGIPTADGLLRLHALAGHAWEAGAPPQWTPTYLRGSSAIPIDRA